jgi:hypothetical protein
MANECRGNGKTRCYLFQCSHALEDKVQVSEFVLRKRVPSGCVVRDMEATVPTDKILRHHQVSFWCFQP